jgi:2-polyprenyl-3-methyl-5-hydroxy-6-metoxy-1,4-benzoquinol methylase
MGCEAPGKASVTTLCELQSLLQCPRCGRGAPLILNDTQATCACGFVARIDQGIVRYTPPEELEKNVEVRARDRQASRYLEHSKFPTQIFRFEQFVASLPSQVMEKPVLELGCGPGPYTRMLLDSSYSVVAVDFSAESLDLNRRTTAGTSKPVCYVQADLNELTMARESTNLLLMCDFLQHLGHLDTRNAFLTKAFSWLAPGGHFYLSFFNFNIKNYFLGDLHGAFAGGAIRYERLLPNEVVAALPDSTRVDSVVPLNIFRHARPDRLASAVPGARYLARMIAISGRKRPD